MTKEEAFERLHATWPMSATYNRNFVDVLVALGLLKLDEPKTANDEARDRLNGAVTVVERLGKDPIPACLSREGAAAIIDMLINSGFVISKAPK